LFAHDYSFPTGFAPEMLSSDVEMAVPGCG